MMVDLAVEQYACTKATTCSEHI